MKNMINSAIICKEKLQKYFTKIINFCISIVYYQYKYNDSHKLSKTFKEARNNLAECAVVLLFTEYIKDSSGIALLSPQNKKIYLNQNEKILNLINNKEWIEAFFQNQKLKSKINEDYFGLSLYEKKAIYRFHLAEEISNEIDMSYRKTILDLLPNYEQELLKYSNNSFEKNIKIKNIYKKFKIQCFSWRGFWADQKMFFIEEGPNFKLKLVNHYTKDFMKPILVPILDMNYYLPSFSAFSADKLFKDKKEKEKFELNMDIDKILKSNDLNQSLIKDLQKNFELESRPGIYENYLRKIYQNSKQIRFRERRRIYFYKKKKYERYTIKKELLFMLYSKNISSYKRCMFR